MRKRLHAVLVGLVAILGVGLVAPAPAGAITGGTVDTANKYSNVGIIAFYDATGRYRCTATLVTPTVLLTAAHCTTGTIGKTIVNFDWFIDDAPPSSLPRAADGCTTPSWADTRARAEWRRSRSRAAGRRDFASPSRRAAEGSSRSRRTLTLPSSCASTAAWCG